MKGKIFVVAVVTLLVLSPGVYAWDNDVHTQMVKDAIALCPKELRIFLKQHINSVIHGSRELNLSLTSPTSYGYNYRKSYYIPEGERGTAPDELKLVSDSVIELLSKRSPESDMIARRMGLICSYAADSIQPKRYIGVAPDYPLDYLVSEKRLTITYNGHNAIDDFSGDLKSFVRGTWNKDLTDEQYYDLAVNYVVDVWTTIWEKAGLPPGEMIAVGSQIRPIPKAVLEAEKTPVKPDTYFDLENLEKSNIYKDTDLKKYKEEDEGFKVEMDRGGGDTTSILPEETVKEPTEDTGTETETETETESSGEPPGKDSSTTYD
jgi:hypothetical protein